MAVGKVKWFNAEKGSDSSLVKKEKIFSFTSLQFKLMDTKH